MATNIFFLTISKIREASIVENDKEVVALTL
jgi:hypothetical protein